MSEKEYIVSLNKGVDYEAFNAEMIASTGAGAIPSRSASVANARPASQRNTHYMLTDEEANTLRNDSRVYGVTLRPDLDPSLEIGMRVVQESDFTKTTLDRGDFVNWGLRRCNEASNPYNGLIVAGGYNYTLDGTGVDVVIQDSGIQANHPEFQDADGVSRVQEIDWFDGYSGGGSMPTGHYTDYDGHGTHCAGIAVGKTYGWAKNARIYAVKVAGLQGADDPNGGIAVSDVFDVIKEWHQSKPVDPATGYKRPTVVNMSWGYSRFYNSVINLTYRGTLYTGTDIDTSSERLAFGLVPLSGAPNATYKTNARVTSVDTDIEELIDAGVHVVIAAGNNYHKIDIDGGDDFDNFIAADTGSVEYHKGSSPYSENAINVGNIDSQIHSGGLEQKAASSETGPGVDVFAPGTNIMSATSNTNKFTDGPYPGNENFRICNISGTSMAAPQVAGMMSLWLQLNPNATVAQAKAFVQSSAKDEQLYSTGVDNDYSNYRSLQGSTSRFLFNKFNSSTQLRIGSKAETVVATPTPTYALSASSNAINEGSSVTVTLTTTNVIDGTQVGYTITGVDSADVNVPLTGSFTVNSNSATLAITAVADATTEGGETMTVSLDGISESVAVTINDTSLTPIIPTYSITPAANNIDEGSALTINVTTTNVSDGTTLYWTVSAADDFGTDSGNFTITSNAGSFTVTPSTDFTTEGAETFTVSLRTGGVSGTVVETTSAITINDTSTTPVEPTYTGLTSVDSADEGDTVTFTVSSALVVDATTVGYTITGINGNDLSAGTLTGNITMTGNSGTVSVTLANDTLTEGTETLTLTLDATDSAGTSTGGLSKAVTINDTSLTPAPTYAATPAANNINEGSALTINVATTNVADATTLYWTVTNAGDFTTTSGSFAITSNAGSFTVTPDADTTTEGAETFTVQIRTGSVSGTVVDTTDAITINDTSTTPAFTPDYTINVTNVGTGAYSLSGTDRNGAVSGSNASLTFNNGDRVRFSVNADGHPFYVKTAQVTGTGSTASGVTSNGSESGNVDWTIGSAGTFYYICQFHGAMTSTITVS